MTDTSEWDPTGEVAAELRNAVKTYGERALSTKQVLENFFSDTFPNRNKGASLLVSGAEAGVAVSLRRHLDEGLDPDNAVMLAGTEFEATRPVPTGSGLWVATQMAAVLGIPVSDRVLTRVGPSPSPEPKPEPQDERVTEDPKPPVDVNGNGNGQPDNLGEQKTIGVTDTPQPPHRETGPSDGSGGGSGRNRTLVIVAGTLAVAVVYLIVAAAAHIAPFSKPTPTTTTTSPPVPTTPIVSTTTSSTLPTPVTPTLAQLMPDQNSSNPLLVPTDCQNVSQPPNGLTGVAASDGCSIPGEDGWELFGYQFDSSSDYSNSVTTYLSDKGFNAGQADSTCPPGSGFQEGQIGWNDQEYPEVSGQNLQCLTFQDSSNSNASDPAYIWELPKWNTIFELIGSSSSSWTEVDTWWTDNGLPSA